MSRRAINLLTPISSPMVTRPTSPTAAGQSQALLVPDDSQIFPADPTASPAAAAAAESAVADLWCSATASPQHVAASVAPVKSRPAVQTGRWRSPPCCSGCGAAKANTGCCSGCGSHFCTSCSPLGGACAHCSSLCLSCKPIACSFCEQREHGPNRLCEACAGTCDGCQRTACSQCSATFSSCSSCGYATCDDCQLQLQLGGLHGSSSSPAGGCCWCAPPIRAAANVRHISTQRYQMAQIHPSFRASSMEAAGLRDADDDDYATYEEYAESSEEGAADGSSTYLTELHQNPQQLRLHDRVPNMTAAEAEAAALVAAVPGAPGVAVSALPAVKIPPALQASSGLGSPSSSYSSSGQLLVGSYLGAASAVGAADGAGGRSAMGGRSSRSIAAG